MAIDTSTGVEVRRKLTPDDVWQMQLRGQLNEAMLYELVDGELIELPPAGFEHSGREVDVAGPLWVFARQAGGRVFSSDAGFLVGRECHNLRSPDVSYIGPHRQLEQQGAWIKGAPDLAVEVLSEGQHGQAYAQPKIQEYFDAGSQLVWFVDLRHREVRVYRPNAEEYTVVRGEGVLTLEPIIGGFSLEVADIFGS